MSKVLALAFGVLAFVFPRGSAAAGPHETFNRTWLYEDELPMWPGVRSPAPIDSARAAVRSYFQCLWTAASLDSISGRIAGGSVGSGREPYPEAYDFWSADWQAAHPYDDFLASWRGTVHVGLLQLLPAGADEGKPRFFVEVRQVELGRKPSFGLFYYFGFYTVGRTPDGWRLTAGGLQPENLAYLLGGHRVGEMVAEDSGIDELQRAGVDLRGAVQEQTQRNPDGSVTVRYLDKGGNDVHHAVLAPLVDGTWRMIDGD